MTADTVRGMDELPASALATLLADRAAAAPHAPVLIDGDEDDAADPRSVTRADLLDAARRWTEALDAARLPAGARVAVVVDDPLAFAVAHLGVMAAGRCSVPLDPGVPLVEHVRATEGGGVVGWITTELVPLVGTVLRADPATGLPLAVTGGLTHPRRSTVPPHPGPARSATLLMTSGSTGRPKGVLLDEQRLLHVARGVADHLRLEQADRGLCPLPLCHVNAQVVGVLSTVVAGSSLVLQRRFHRHGFWARARAHDITWLNAVPAILTVLAREPAAPLPPRLRLVRSASAPLPPAVCAATEERLGVPVVESYGMTEAASQITATALDGSSPVGSVGRPIGAAIEIRDVDGRAVPAGERGRVHLRGAGVIAAYDGATASDRFDADGWLDTGDLGWRNEAGDLFLTGRADDVINRGGELVHPREIEDVLVDDDQVAEAVVVGRPDAVLGAVPVACIRAADPADPAAPVDTTALVATVSRRCRARLSRWKCPAEVIVLDTFPRCATGKVDRPALRAVARRATPVPDTTSTDAGERSRG